MSLSQSFNQKLVFKTPDVSNANFNDSPPESYQTTTAPAGVAAAMNQNRRAIEREQRLQARLRHMPVVLGASRSLQAVCGLEAGTKMVGETPVKLWELPKESVQDIVKHAQMKMAESLKKGKGGDGPPPVVMSGASGHASQPGQSHQRTPQIPEIVVHSPGRPATASAPRPYQPPAALPAQQQHPLPARPLSALACPPASPPPDWAPPIHISHHYHIPCYNSVGLARELNKWLAKSSTRSKQLLPARVELRDAQSNRLFVGIDATSCAKLKISRIELPSAVLEGPSAGPNTERPRDWIVVEVRHAPIPPRAQVTAEGRVREWGEILPGEAMDDDEEKPFIPCAPGECPFWLLAFPFCAITDSKVEVREQERSDRPQLQNVQGAKAFETLFLGGKGRAPIVCCRGLDPKFAKEFLEACGNGKGLLAFNGLGSLLTW